MPEHSWRQSAKVASKEQKEGIARVLDTLAASSIIGLGVNVSGHTVLNVNDIIVLCFLSAGLPAIAWIL